MAALLQGNASTAIVAAREQLGAPIAAAGARKPYGRVYDSITHLHILHELEVVYQAGADTFTELTEVLSSRLRAASPAFRTRESILNMRRTALRMRCASASATFRHTIANEHSNIIGHQALLGPMWLESAKIARNAGHGQTAYSAVLRADQLNAPSTYLQSAKLKHADHHQDQRAIQDLSTVIAPYERTFASQTAGSSNRPLAHAELSVAKVRHRSEWQEARTDSGHRHLCSSRAGRRSRVATTSTSV
jgi:serine/threonine-protein kinase ATR